MGLRSVFTKGIKVSDRYNLTSYDEGIDPNVPGRKIRRYHLYDLQGKKEIILIDEGEVGLDRVLVQGGPQTGPSPEMAVLSPEVARLFQESRRIVEVKVPLLLQDFRTMVSSGGLTGLDTMYEKGKDQKGDRVFIGLGDEKRSYSFNYTRSAEGILIGGKLVVSDHDTPFHFILKETPEVQGVLQAVLGNIEAEIRFLEPVPDLTDERFSFVFDKDWQTFLSSETYDSLDGRLEGVPSDTDRAYARIAHDFLRRQGLQRETSPADLLRILGRYKGTRSPQEFKKHLVRESMAAGRVADKFALAAGKFRRRDQEYLGSPEIDLLGRVRFRQDPAGEYKITFQPDYFFTVLEKVLARQSGGRLRLRERSY